MRYFLDNSTLFVRGSFRAVNIRTSASVLPVSTLLIHTVNPKKKHVAPEKELELVAAAAGIGPGYTGLLTTVPVQDLCVLQYDFVTVFIVARHGAVRKNAGDPVSIIVCSGQGLTDAALHETAAVVKDAMAEAPGGIAGQKRPSPPGGVIVACEGAPEHNSAGPQSPVGTRVRAAILHGIAHAIKKQAHTGTRKRPSLFIFSRFKGEHWTEWSPEDCPYYPCHFEGQRCDFCYCPLYPCGDEALGQWVESSNGGKVWNCARCTMIHEPAVADYLLRNPEASKDELVRVWKLRKK
ncbi:MAG: Cysteine-rich small domain protein [Methanoregula sp. PtaU1.Bin051]|nr:MAG: Cysteine-rich small domain protein [Methanoregula sp. PtaU1.Bin051]